jgi:hypothetical protein
MPAGLVARFEHLLQQRGPAYKLTTLYQRPAFPVAPEDFSNSRVKSRREIVHRRHTLLGDGNIARHQRDGANGMVQDPAQCKPGICSSRFLEAYTGLVGSLLHITLLTKNTCQPRPGEHPLVIVKQDFVPSVFGRGIVFNHAFEATPCLGGLSVE